jgi:hypothetical protein
MLLVLVSLGAVVAGLEVQRDRLVTEIRALPPYPGAQLVHEESGFKPTLAIASHTFVSLAQTDLIVEHYTRALQEAAWLPRSNINHDGQVSLCFTRGSDAAFVTVQPIGDPNKRYEITLDWNGPRCQG